MALERACRCWLSRYVFVSLNITREWAWLVWVVQGLGTRSLAHAICMCLMCLYFIASASREVWMEHNMSVHSAMLSFVVSV